jgi:hypothetical protein
MQKGSAGGYVVAPMWREFMDFAIQKYPSSSFIDPQPIAEDAKPVIRGIWENPSGVHEILHWVIKDNPLGDYPSRPASDPQYILWEEPVQKWLAGESFDTKQTQSISLKILNPEQGNKYIETLDMFVAVTLVGAEIKSGEVFLNGDRIGSLSQDGTYTFKPSRESASKKRNNRLQVEVIDTNGEEHKDSVSFDLE